MGTTTSGIWYPEPGDTYNEVSTLATMASSIENVVGDHVRSTGEIILGNPISGSGFALFGAEPTVLSVEGKVAQLTGAVKPTGSTLSSSPFYNIPSAYRPIRSIYPKQTSSGSNVWTLVVGNDGNLRAERYGPGAFVANTLMPFSAMWLIA